MTELRTRLTVIEPVELDDMTPPVAVSDAMQHVLARVAVLPDDVLIHAEPGAGARTLARVLHQRWRAEHPLVVVDSRGVHEAIVEATLDGLERSVSFGGRGGQVHRGAFEVAAMGTVLLLELAALPRTVHRLVVRMIEERRVRRVGTNVFRPAPARVIATTRHDPDDLVAADRLAPELRAAFRDAVIRIPPLRERPTDIVPLLRAFLGDHRISATVEQRLAQLAWPGNGAELRDVAGRLVDHAPDSVLAELELEQEIRRAPTDQATRLVYGDLLLARGDPRGELVHVQSKLAEHPTDEQLLARERELLAAHGEAWLARVLALPGVVSAQLRRGFVEAVVGRADVLRDLGPLFAAAPTITELAIDPVDTPPVPADVFAHAVELANVRVLRLSVGDTILPTATALARCPHVGGVRELSLSVSRAVRGLPLDADSARVLARSPQLAKLERLVLQRCSVGAKALAALLSPRAAWKLATLRIEDAELGTAARAVIDRATVPTTVELA